MVVEGEKVCLIFLEFYKIRFRKREKESKGKKERRERGKVIEEPLKINLKKNAIIIIKYVM